MTPEHQQFYSAALSAGAILTGFCGTFLSFRIQREANYHRQPAVDFASGKGKDVAIGLSHFSSGFLILILAGLTNIAFGMALPLLSLAELRLNWITPKFVTAGIMSGLWLICTYFWIELRHYNIISNRLLGDRYEWGRQTISVAISISVAAIIFYAVAYTF